MSTIILLIGAFDVKGEEYAFVKKQIENQDCSVLTMNIGVLGDTDLFTTDIPNKLVAKAGGAEIETLQKDKDRGKAMEAMAKGAAALTRHYFDEGKFHGVLGMGGSGGTSVISSAMRALPIGVPKVLVSTVAAGDLSLIHI